MLLVFCIVTNAEICPEVYWNIFYYWYITDNYLKKILKKILLVSDFTVSWGRTFLHRVNTSGWQDGPIKYGPPIRAYRCISCSELETEPKWPDPCRVQFSLSFWFMAVAHSWHHIPFACPCLPVQPGLLSCFGMTLEASDFLSVLKPHFPPRFILR